VFEGVPQMSVPLKEIEKGIPVIDFLSVNTNIFPSKGEAKKMLAGGGVFINKEKVEDVNFIIGTHNLIREKYILAQKGKKNYYLIKTT
jgi:tyrosyl-tRNA synthetase